MDPSWSQLTYNELLTTFDRGKGSWWTRPALLKLNLSLLMPLFSSAAVGYDGTMMNGLQSLSQWRSALHEPSAVLLGVLNAIVWIGALLALPLASYANDYHGRKKTMLFGLFFAAIGAILQTASQNIGTFLAARFLIGCASIFLGLPSPILIAEVAYPKHRAKITAMYNTLFYIGAILASWTTYGTFRLYGSWSWRVPSAVQAAIPLLQVSLYPWCPESPRWLYAQGQIVEARAILTKFHGDGDDASSLVDWEMNEIAEAILSAKAAKRTSWKAMVDTSGARHRTFICIVFAFMAQWAGNGVISYYFSLVLNTIGIEDAERQTLIIGIFQLFNFVCALTASMSVDKIGRRSLLLWASIGMTICFSIATALSAEFAKHNQKGVAVGVLAFIFLFFFHYDIGFTTLVLAYPAEIMPYAMRNKGMTLVTGCTCVAIVFNLFANPIALAAITWKFYLVYVVLLVCMVIVIYLAFPETKGYSLEQIANIFDKGSSPPLQYNAEFNSGTQMRHPDATDKPSTLLQQHELL